MWQWYRDAVWYAYGSLHYTRKGFEKAQLSFIPQALEVDLKGKTAIVTGANSGIGLEVTKELARRGTMI